MLALMIGISLIALGVYAAMTTTPANCILADYGVIERPMSCNNPDVTTEMYKTEEPTTLPSMVTEKPELEPTIIVTTLAPSENNSTR